MNPSRKLLVLSCTALLSLSLCCFAGCGGGNASSGSANSANGSAQAGGSASAAATAQDGSTVTREDVEAALRPAFDAEYENVAFSTKVDSTANYTENGQAQQQSVETTTTGELDRSADNPRAHATYSSRTSSEIGVTSYEMFVDNDNVLIVQDDKVYRDSSGDEGASSYIKSVMSATSEDEISKMLDVANTMKMATGDEGETTVTITADVDRLADSDIIDTSSLPEGSSVATLVVSYTVGKDGRFSAIHIMSSTTGMPTYRTVQTYRFFDYNTTEMPAWPDVSTMLADQSNIQTDENGNAYIVGDDGTIYYITGINEDGTVSYTTGTPGTNYIYTPMPQYVEGEEESYQTQKSAGSYNDKPAGSFAEGDTSDAEIDDSTPATFTEGDSSTTTSTTTDTTSTTNSGSTSDDQGRAYITAADGTIHYLDEEGSQIIDVGGSRVFVDANGEWYFLSEE